MQSSRGTSVVASLLPPTPPAREARQALPWLATSRGRASHAVNERWFFFPHHDATKKCRVVTPTLHVSQPPTSQSLANTKVSKRREDMVLALPIERRPRRCCYAVYEYALRRTWPYVFTSLALLLLMHLVGAGGERLTSNQANQSMPNSLRHSYRELALRCAHHVLCFHSYNCIVSFSPSSLHRSIDCRAIGL